MLPVFFSFPAFRPPGLTAFLIVVCSFSTVLLINKENQFEHFLYSWGTSMNEEKYILTMLVENEPGVTARVSGLFASRGYNIETICGAPTANPDMSRITITTNAQPDKFEQIMKQLRRLVNVIKLRDMTGEEAVKREMALICVKAEPENRVEIRKMVETFRGRIVDTGETHFIIEITGRQKKINALIQLLEPMGIKKVARSGILALYREPG